ncbi:MAG: winged helix-turn-helix domain-containing protein [Lachnospiraceae bacterium]
MNNKIIMDLDWLEEGYSLICQYAKNERFEDILQKIRERYHRDAHVWEELTSVYQKIDLAAEHSFHNRRETIEHYFKPIQDSKGCLADLVYYKTDQNPKESVDDYKKRMSCLKEEEWNQEFDKKILEWGNTIRIEAVREVSSMDIIRHIGELSLPKEEKWKIQELYLEKEDSSRQILDLITESVELLRKMENEIRPCLLKFASYWEGFLSQTDLGKYLREQLDIDFISEFQQVELWPKLLQPKTVSISCNGEEVPVSEIVHLSIGIMFNESFPMTRKMKEQELPEEFFLALKLLCDKSKFDILTFIKTDWAYGSQIAKKMNLTTATISYHMGSLLEQGLVELRRVENKIYYRQKQERVREILKFCEKRLLL